MTIKEEEKSPTFSLKAFLGKHALLITVALIVAFCGLIVNHVETKNNTKWANLKENHPAIRIERRNESNLLTNQYSLIKIDGKRHISVKEAADSSTSYSYELSEVQIYETIK